MDLIDRQAAIDVVHKAIFDFFDICDDDEESPMTYTDEKLLEVNKSISTQIKSLPSAQHTCETCYYWGNRIILRDGSLGDCGNFGVNLSKDFYCAWWSPKEEKDG